MARSLRVGERLYATDWRPEGQPVECKVISADVVNEWSDSNKHTYVLEWTDGTQETITGPYNHHPLDRNLSVANRARAGRNPAVVAERAAFWGEQRDRHLAKALRIAKKAAGSDLSQEELRKLADRMRKAALTCETDLLAEVLPAYLATIR